MGSITKGLTLVNQLNRAASTQLWAAHCFKASTYWPSGQAWSPAASQLFRQFANSSSSRSTSAADGIGLDQSGAPAAAAAAEGGAKVASQEDSPGTDQSDRIDSSSGVDVALLQQQLAKAQEEAASYKDRWQRSHAEMQNLIARQTREKESIQTYAVQKFAQSLLEVADNLESAARAVPLAVLQEGAQVSSDKAMAYLRSLLEGVLATEKVLLKTMASKGVERIEMSEGDAFDPNTQEAMSVLPCTQPEHSPGTIAAKWQSGYKIHDRVLRAAKVIVFQE